MTLLGPWSNTLTSLSGSVNIEGGLKTRFPHNCMSPDQVIGQGCTGMGRVFNSVKGQYQDIWSITASVLHLHGWSRPPLPPSVPSLKRRYHDWLRLLSAYERSIPFFVLNTKTRKRNNGSVIPFFRFLVLDKCPYPVVRYDMV
jgi:hypothetical protein